MKNFINLSFWVVAVWAMIQCGMALYFIRLAARDHYDETDNTDAWFLSALALSCIVVIFALAKFIIK